MTDVRLYCCHYLANVYLHNIFPDTNTPHFTGNKVDTTATSEQFRLQICWLRQAFFLLLLLHRCSIKKIIFLPPMRSKCIILHYNLLTRCWMTLLLEVLILFTHLDGYYPARACFCAERVAYPRPHFACQLSNFSFLTAVGNLKFWHLWWPDQACLPLLHTSACYCSFSTFLISPDVSVVLQHCYTLLSRWLLPKMTLKSALFSCAIIVRLCLSSGQ